MTLNTKVQVFRLATGRIKIHQISPVIFRTKSQFFFKLCITIQCPETKLFCTFSSKTWYALHKMCPPKCTFSDFRLLAWKLIKFLISFYKRQFSFKFCITLQCHDSVIALKFSSWNVCFGQKEPIKVQLFRLLSALMKVHPVLHASFETTRSGFIQILHHCSVPWKITPPYFLAQTSYTLDKKSPLK